MSVITLASHLDQSWRGEKLIVKTPSHILHKKGKGFDLVRWVPVDDLGSACLHWSGLWHGRRTSYHLGQSLGAVLERGKEGKS